MIGLDTNVLARYYIDDDSDDETVRQRQAARQLIESGMDLMVCKTVVLELEWVMRGYYGFSSKQALTVLRHLFSLAHVNIEDRSTLELALANADAGIDFADATHHASYRGCERIASFDDKKFARRSRKLGMSPSVFVPA